MNNLKKIIEKNLYLRVDFSNKYKKTKQGIIQDTKFFLIGVLPVAIIYKNGEKEKASINYSLLVGRDPYLRKLQGAKATDKDKVKGYEIKIKDIVSGLIGGFSKITESGKFNNKEFEKILIINFDLKDAGNSNHKNRGDQALLEECKKTSDQAN